MEEAEVEEYIEVPDEVEVYEEDDFTFGDALFIIGFILLICGGITFILGVLKKNVKNIHFKLGNKVELGLETKDDEKK